MKNTLLKSVASIALLVAAGTAQAAIQDVAANGGFETGDFSGWTQFPQSGIQTIINPGNGSANAVNLTVPIRTELDPPVDNVLKNANLGAGLLTPGAAVSVTFDMRGELFGAGGVVFIELFSELSGGGVSKQEFFMGGPLFPNDPVNWQSFVWNTTLGPDVSGGVTLQLKTACGPVEGCGSSVDFDNITISTDVAAVPVPAAAWLFGSALLGLGGLARKKKAA